MKGHRLRDRKVAGRVFARLKMAKQQLKTKMRLKLDNDAYIYILKKRMQLNAKAS